VGQQRWTKKSTARKTWPLSKFHAGWTTACQTVPVAKWKKQKRRKRRFNKTKTATEPASLIPKQSPARRPDRPAPAEVGTKQKREDAKKRTRSGLETKGHRGRYLGEACPQRHRSPGHKKKR